MSITMVNFHVILLLLSSLTMAFCMRLEDTYEDFEVSLGIFNRVCQPGMMIFRRERYENHFFPSSGGGNYFLTTDRTSCSQTDLLETENSVEIELFLFKFREPSSVLSLQILDPNDVVLHSLNSELDVTTNWTTSNFSFTPETPFRIRLLYNTTFNGVQFALDYININVIETCVKDEFVNEEILLGGACVGEDNLDNLVYDSYSNAGFPLKPFGSSNYFLSTYFMNQNGFCSTGRVVKFLNNSELVMTVYMENQMGTNNTGYIFIDDANQTDVICDYHEFKIDDSRTWKMLRFNVRHVGVGRIRMMIPLLRNESYLAIDSIGVRLLDAEDCISVCKECSRRRMCPRSYAATEDLDTDPGSGLSATSLIVSTTILVSIVCGSIFTVFVVARSRESKQITR